MDGIAYSLRQLQLKETYYKKMARWLLREILLTAFIMSVIRGAEGNGGLPNKGDIHVT